MLTLLTQFLATETKQTTHNVPDALKLNTEFLHSTKQTRGQQTLKLSTPLRLIQRTLAQPFAFDCITSEQEKTHTQPNALSNAGTKMPLKLIHTRQETIIHSILERRDCTAQQQ